MARNLLYKACKHSNGEVLAVGSCRACNRERRKIRPAPGVRVRFREGYHHGLGEYVSTERELYRKAEAANGVVRWD